MDENTLIIRAKRGNKKAREILVEQYQPFIGKLITQFHFPKDDYQDMIQEGNIGILIALQKYTIPNKFPFSSLVYLEIQNSLFAFVMKNSIITCKKNKKKVIVEFVNDVMELKHQPDVEDEMVYDFVIRELINEVFTLDDFRRFLVSRKYGLFGHFPLTVKGLRVEANKRFNKKYTESQIKNRLVYAVKVLRRSLKAKGIEGGDIWKIKNSLVKTMRSKKAGKKRQNFLKVMSSGMVVGHVFITKSYWKRTCFCH